MASENIYSDTLARDKLRIRKHQMRQVSPLYFTGDQTEAVATNLYDDFTVGNVVWERSFDLAEYLVKHSYTQKFQNVKGDAYAQLCAFGQYEADEAAAAGESASAAEAYSSRRVVSAVCCHTIEIPDTVFNANETVHGGVDLDTLMFYVVGDQWLSRGCHVAVFVSGDEHPPAFGELIEKMNTPGAEKMGDNCWAGWVGATLPTDDDAVRYLRTNVICDTGWQGSPSQWQGVKEPLFFKIHNWAIDDYDETLERYKLKKYIHIMLFLTQSQYTETRDNWIEGSAIINLSSISLSFTHEVKVPDYVYDLCGLSHGNLGGGTTKAIDLQGGIFSLVNTFRMTDAQAAPLKKDNAEACVFSAIETAVSRISIPNAVYGWRSYPPITSYGFDFYMVGVGGSEYIRIGCIDENAMSLSTNTPLPSVYSLLVGYPVNPGFTPNIYDRMIFTDGVDSFSGCIRVQVVIYKGTHGENASTDGRSYGYGTSIDQTQFNAKEFFGGNSSRLVLETGESVPLSLLYSAYHTHILEGQEFPFNENAKFDKPGFLLIGVSPVEFTNEGSINDGDWGQYAPPEYHSQYMQLVDWPISQTVKVTAIE